MTFKSFVLLHKKTIAIIGTMVTLFCFTVGFAAGQIVDRRALSAGMDRLENEVKKAREETVEQKKLEGVCYKVLRELNFEEEPSNTEY